MKRKKKKNQKDKEDHQACAQKSVQLNYLWPTLSAKSCSMPNYSKQISRINKKHTIRRCLKDLSKFQVSGQMNKKLSMLMSITTRTSFLHMNSVVEYQVMAAPVKVAKVPSAYLIIKTPRKIDQKAMKTIRGGKRTKRTKRDQVQTIQTNAMQKKQTLRILTNQTQIT